MLKIFVVFFQKLQPTARVKTIKKILRERYWHYMKWNEQVTKQLHQHDSLVAKMVKNNCEIKLGLHLTSPSLQTACNPHNLGPIPGSTKALALAFKVTVLWILGTNIIIFVLA